MHPQTLNFILCNLLYLDEMSGSRGDEYEDDWDVAPCSLVNNDQRFRGDYCLHHQDDYGSSKHF
jgi:hypothetical protein